MRVEFLFDFGSPNAYLAHKAGYRPDLHRGLGRSARGRAKTERRVEALHIHTAKARARQDGA